MLNCSCIIIKLKKIINNIYINYFRPKKSNASEKINVNYDIYKKLEGSNTGKTIFIVGAGPQLAYLSSDSLERLELLTTIAVNKVFYKFKPKYFITSYIGEMMLAVNRIPDSMLLHMRPNFEPPFIPGIIPVRRMQFEHGMNLPKKLDIDCPTLLTRLNVALGATHLAYILGAKKIVFIGVEQRNQLHFWNYDEEIRRNIYTDLINRGDHDMMRIDHPYASLERDLESLNRPLEECMKPFYDIDHTPTFKAYFEILNRNGVDVVATTRESIVADAGARVVDLNEILAGSEV